ncbi:hypothetical protein FSHL1_000021 [Fusarium sambucinum]
MSLSRLLAKLKQPHYRVVPTNKKHIGIKTTSTLWTQTHLHTSSSLLRVHLSFVPFFIGPEILNFIVASKTPVQIDCDPTEIPDINTIHTAITLAVDAMVAQAHQIALLLFQGLPRKLGPCQRLSLLAPSSSTWMLRFALVSIVVRRISCAFGGLSGSFVKVDIHYITFARKAALSGIEPCQSNDGCPSRKIIAFSNGVTTGTTKGSSSTNRGTSTNNKSSNDGYNAVVDKTLKVLAMTPSQATATAMVGFPDVVVDTIMPAHPITMAVKLHHIKGYCLASLSTLGNLRT